jgi:hypothetical protein
MTRQLLRCAPLAACAAALAIWAAGCGGSPSASGGQAAQPKGQEVNPAGDIPDNQAYVPYQPPAGGFTVDVPEGWSRSASARVTTFTDKLNSIAVESVPASAPPTVADTTRTELPKLATTVKGYQAGTVTSVRRKAGTAVEVTYVGDSTPDPVTGTTRQDAVERYTFFHSGNDVILTLSGPTGADNVDPWRIVTDSLAWTR